MVELWRIELQSETQLHITSTCLEKLFSLTWLHTTCKIRPSEPLAFILSGDTLKIYLHKGYTSNPIYPESIGEAARRPKPGLKTYATA